MKALLKCFAGCVALGLPLAAEATIVNIQFNGQRNVPGPRGPAPHYIGIGPAGGGTNFNTFLADSALADGTDDDNLTVGGTNLVDSLGNPTTVIFTVSPMGGDDPGIQALGDPTNPQTLFSGYIFNNSAGNTAGESPWTITGLGSTAIVDLYFFYRSGAVTIPGATNSPFAGSGIFNSGNTLYFRSVPVTNSTVSGTFGGGTAVIYGMTVVIPPPHPFVVASSPSGTAVATNAVVAIEVQDYVTQLATDSIQLFLNNQAITPAISRPPGTNVTTITYVSPGGLAQGSSNTVTLIFADTGSPPSLQTNTFTFGVLNYSTAADIVNIQFNGQRNVPGPRGPAPSYVGQGAAGGGTTFNTFLADSAQADGTDDDNLTVGGSNLLDSIGNQTPIGFTLSPVAGDDTGPPATGDPTSPSALFGAYVFNNSAGNNAGQSPFAISDLEGIPYVNLYFYVGVGTIAIPGSKTAPYLNIGAPAAFTPGNTVFFPTVPVVSGSVSGSFGPGVTVVHGMAIQKPPAGAFFLSGLPTGRAVPTNAVITAALEDYVTTVTPDSIQLLLDGQPVNATITKPAGTNVTTVTYAPPAGLASGSTNTVQLIFSDNATPAAFHTNTFSFVVIDYAAAPAIINIGFNGQRNVPGPRGPGPTFVGQGAAGGGTTFNGLPADSALADGTDDDNITVTGSNLLNSLGGTTAVGFTLSPVGGDDGGDPAGTDPTSPNALFGEYVFVGSAGQISGTSTFTISGLGGAATVDLYFYYGANGNISVPGATNTPFAASGIYNSGNTIYFQGVAVNNGTITGTFGSGPVSLLYGLTIAPPFKSSSGQGPTLSLTRQGSGLVISWQGAATLQSTSAVGGPWMTIQTATSPYNVTPPLLGSQFYRLKQ